MNPLLLAVVGFLASQTIAVGLLMADASRIPLPGWLFPVTGRWRVYLVRGYLAFTGLGPVVAVVALSVSPHSGGVEFPLSLSMVWLVVESMWLIFSTALVGVVFAMLDLPRRPAAVVSKGKAFLPRNDKRNS